MEPHTSKKDELSNIVETTTISKMKLRIYLVLGMMGYLVSIFTAYSPVVADLLRSEDKQMINKYLEDSKYQRFKDSIQNIIDIREQRYNAENRDKIYHLMDALRRELVNSKQIIIYYTHDSGGIPVTGSPLNVTVIYNANNVEPCLDRNYWQNRVLPQAYVKINKRAREAGFIHIPDILRDVDINSDMVAIEELECNRAEALTITYIKESGYAVYYLAVIWGNDYQDGFYKIKNTLRKYSAEIGLLIKAKQKN